MLQKIKIRVSLVCPEWKLGRVVRDLVIRQPENG